MRVEGTGLFGAASQEALERRRPEPVLRWPDPLELRLVEVKPSAAMFKTFMTLADAEPAAIRAFAARYGPLGIGHLVVRGDQANQPRSGSDALEALIASRVPLGNYYRPGTALIEPVDGWRASAGWVRQLVQIAGDLQRRKPTSATDWRAFEHDAKEPAEAWLPSLEDGPHAMPLTAWRAMTSEQKRSWLVTEQRSTLAVIVDEWLQRAGVRARFHWGPRRKGIAVVGLGSLDAALALQVAESIARQAVPYLCFNCGRTYQPKRTPAWNRRNYCDREVCQESRKRHFRLM